MSGLRSARAGVCEVARLMKQERSAGIVVFYVDPNIPDRREFLLLDYGRHWDYVKGHLNPGEDDASAAARELIEETGIERVDLIEGFAKEITYFFRDRKSPKLVRKTVVFFLGRVFTRAVTLSDEHVGYTFLPFDETRRKLSYPSARKVLDQAEEKLLLMKTTPLLDLAPPPAKN